MTATTQRPFSHAALTWLRDRQHLRTAEMPTDHLDEVDGRVRIDAYVPRGRLAGQLGFAVLCAFILGTILLLTHPPHGSARALAVLHTMGIGANVVAAILAVAALVVHKLQREHYLVELRVDAHPVEPEAIDRLQADAAGRRTWLLARAGIPAETVARARRDGVRCFELAHDRWIER